MNMAIYPARIAQMVAYRLGTGEVPGSKPGKGENFSVKIGNWTDIFHFIIDRINPNISINLFII